MKISMTMIAHKLKHYNIKLYLPEKENLTINKIKFLSQKKIRFDESCVYLCNSKNFNQNLFENEINIIIIGNKDFNLDKTNISKFNLIYIDANTDLLEVFNEIQDIFTFYQKWDSELQDAIIMGKDLQHIIDASFNYFQNPMYLIDASFRTLAYTKKVGANEIDELWKSVVINGHTDIETVNAMKKNNILAWLNSCNEPIINPSPIFSHRRINANIIDGNGKLGTLIIIELYNQLDKAHLHMAIHLVKIILLSLQKNETFQNTQGEIYKYFFADLLKGKISNKNLIQDQFKFLGWSVQDNFFVLKVQMGEPDILNNTLEFTVRQLKNILGGSHSIIFDKYIIIIINQNKSVIFKKDTLSQINLVLEKSNLFGGLSSCCKDILNLEDYHIQASVAIDLGRIFDKSKFLYRYEDYALYHVIQVCSEKMDLLKICHPSVLKLLAYDQEKKTDYYNTLRIYINNNNNLVESAKLLFVHRNTLVYRINKINELVPIDFHKENVKTHMLFSYQILDYLDKLGKNI